MKRVIFLLLLSLTVMVFGESLQEAQHQYQFDKQNWEKVQKGASCGYKGCEKDIRVALQDSIDNLILIATKQLKPQDYNKATFSLEKQIAIIDKYIEHLDEERALKTLTLKEFYMNAMNDKDSLDSYTKLYKAVNIIKTLHPKGVPYTKLEKKMISMKSNFLNISMLEGE